MDDPLNINNEMRQFDRKNRHFYDDLTDEQRKKFSPYLMIRWGSAIEGSRELQEYYVIATNERFNKRFFSVNTSQHKKLQWLLATTVSPNMGTHRHPWIAPRKKDTQDSAKKKLLAELFPDLRDSEINVLAAVNDIQDIKDYHRARSDPNQ